MVTGEPTTHQRTVVVGPDGVGPGVVTGVRGRVTGSRVGPGYPGLCLRNLGRPTYSDNGRHSGTGVSPSSRPLSPSPVVEGRSPRCRVRRPLLPGVFKGPSRCDDRPSPTGPVSATRVDVGPIPLNPRRVVVGGPPTECRPSVPPKGPDRNFPSRTPTGYLTLPLLYPHHVRPVPSVPSPGPTSQITHRVTQSPTHLSLGSPNKVGTVVPPHDRSRPPDEPG